MLENFLFLFTHSFDFILSTLILIILFFVLKFYIKDKNDNRHTLRKNFPVLGRMRWLLEYLGIFYRSYFLESDRNGRPFSRHIRSYLYRSAKDNKRTVAFGSTENDMNRDFMFINSMYPYESKETVINSIVFGNDLKNPYNTNSIFNVSGMSFGALSKEAIQALSHGMKLSGGWLNTGEGGLSKYHLESDCDIVFQIGTAKYGVANEDLTLNIEKLKKLASIENVKMFEIKLSQGAKPSKGGILPASKVNKEIAETRDIKIGEASISPNNHAEVKNTKTLLELIKKVKFNSQKPTGIKLCFGCEEQMDDLIQAFKEAKDSGDFDSIPSFITIDSSDGGTGAAPMAFIDAIGMNIKQSLPMFSKKLDQSGLRDEIKIIASGKLVDPINIAWAFAVGADTVSSGRGFLFSLGCIQARLCNKNKCPTGITTHNPKYTKGLIPEMKKIRVKNYHYNTIRDLNDIAHACGVKDITKLTEKNIRFLSIPIYNNGN
jgi:glutamate synthase domain-containing protein 2